MKKLIICFLLFFIFTLNIYSVSANEINSDMLSSTINKIYEAKKNQYSKEHLFCDEYLSNNIRFDDWYPFAIGRIQIEDDYYKYLGAIDNYYNNRLSYEKHLNALDCIRMCLACVSLGDSKLACDFFKKGIELNNSSTALNNCIWFLIAIDALDYESSSINRDFLINNIISRQLEDGGFSLLSDSMDPDLTATAIISLSRYYNVDENVKEVIDKAIDVLSIKQDEKAGYSSYGISNVESSCQVALALMSINIDIMNDSRFIKNGLTILDNIIMYQLEDDMFSHELNKGKSEKATEQVLYTLGAIKSFINGDRYLFDLKKEFSYNEKILIDKININIDNLNSLSKLEDVNIIVNDIYSIKQDIRYVKNYYKLIEFLNDFNISIEIDLKKGINKGFESIIINNINEVDLDRLLQNKDDISLYYYYDILKYSYILNNYQGFVEKKTAINEMKQEVLEIKQKVDFINNKLDNPNVSKEDMKSIKEMYECLSEYDKKLVNDNNHYLIDSSYKLYIYIGLSVLILIIAFFTIKYLKKQKKESF